MCSDFFFTVRERSTMWFNSFFSLPGVHGPTGVDHVVRLFFSLAWSDISTMSSGLLFHCPGRFVHCGPTFFTSMVGPLHVGLFPLLRGQTFSLFKGESTM